MLPIELRTPREIARILARRVRALRLELGWTQQELADRTGLALATYRRFERSGHISLERLIKVAVVLDRGAELDRLFVRSDARSMADLERRAERQARQRGRRRDAHT